MAEIAADRPRVGLHGHRLQTHARERPQIGDEHAVIGLPRAIGVEIEGIGVLHQELAAAHDAEPRAHLVAELPLDVIEVFRQVAIGLHRIAEDLRDLLLVRRPEQHVALVPVLDAQHLRAVIAVAPALLPDLRRLDGGHQELDGASPVLLLANDLLDLFQNAKAKRQPRINPGAGLADHARPQHEPMGDDFRLFGIVAQNREKITAEFHEFAPRLACRGGLSRGT